MSLARGHRWKAPKATCFSNKLTDDRLRSCGLSRRKVNQDNGEPPFWVHSATYIKFSRPGVLRPPQDAKLSSRILKYRWTGLPSILSLSLSHPLIFQAIMFTTPKKAFMKLRAHPYLSPLKLFGLAETPTPVSSPGGHSVPPPLFNPLLSAAPPARKRYGAYNGPSSSPLKPRPFRPVGRAYHRVGVRRTASLRMHRSLGRAKAASDCQFSGLTRVAFETANQARMPLTHEDHIFLEQLAKLAADREIATSLAEARTAVERAADLAPLINAEREAKAQASLTREKEQERAFAAQREAKAAAEATRRERREKAKRRHQEREAFRRQEEERTRLENERLAQEQRNAQAFADAALRFQQVLDDQLKQQQAARLRAQQEARAWFEAQQTETAAKHARPQCNSRGFDGVDVSMIDVSMRAEMDASMRAEMDASMRTEIDASMRTEMDASMFIDMDASMRTAAPYSPPRSPSPPPPPPPLTVADRFALYERKWTALKSDVPVLSFEVLPWPILHDVSAPEDITEERMAEFFYSPERPGYENKTQKERSRIELLRWHPDKFLGKVLGKVDAGYRAMVEEAIGQVTRFLVASAAS